MLPSVLIPIFKRWITRFRPFINTLFLLNKMNYIGMLIFSTLGHKFWILTNIKIMGWVNFKNRQDFIFLYYLFDVINTHFCSWLVQAAPVKAQPICSWAKRAILGITIIFLFTDVIMCLIRKSLTFVWAYNFIYGHLSIGCNCNQGVIYRFSLCEDVLDRLAWWTFILCFC